ncbi:hypothetical protein HYW82_00680, partial [Candidatus Peregrinibacteria bacterium]|nr:hypothetical protein [Candidatus Peregrinibacteria bacterium]
MRNIVSYFPKDAFSLAGNLFRREGGVTFSGGGNASSKAMLLSDIFRNNGLENTLWVVSSVNDIGIMEKALASWGERPVFTYRKRADDEMLSFASSTEFFRVKNMELVEFVSRIVSNKDAIFITDFMSLLQDFPDSKKILEEKISLKTGEKFDTVDFIESIVSIGYEVSDESTLRKGRYIRAGDSILISPINLESVVRIEFGFSELEKINFVDPADYSKNTEDVKSVDIFPLE